MTPKRRWPLLTLKRSVAKAQNWVTHMTPNRLAQMKKGSPMRTPACPSRKKITRLAAKKAPMSWNTRLECTARTSKPYTGMIPIRSSAWSPTA
jgi:hypothetical protein